MGRIRLGVGTEWLLDGRAWRVVRQLAPDRFVAQDTKFLVEQEFSQEELLAHYSAGRLRFAADDTAPTKTKPPTVKPAPIQDLTAHEKRSLQRRWSALEPLTLLGRAPQEIDYTNRVAELQGEGQDFSARTLRRYYQAWLLAGKDRMALAPRIARAGQSRGARKSSLLEKHPQIRKLVDEAIQAVYLTKARRPISAVTRRVLEDHQRLNSRLPAAQAIPMPRQSALDRAIGRRISRLDPWEVDTQRWGRKIADCRHAPTSPQQLATGVLQRVEIDHSPSKVVVGTEAGPIGQPWLSLLIDYYSRMVVGFCLGFEPPSYAVLLGRHPSGRRVRGQQTPHGFGNSSGDVARPRGGVSAVHPGHTRRVAGALVQAGRPDAVAPRDRIGRHVLSTRSGILSCKDTVR